MKRNPNVFTSLKLITPEMKDLGKIAFMKSYLYPYLIWSRLIYHEGRRIATQDRKWKMETVLILEKEQAEILGTKLAALREERKKALEEVERNYNEKVTDLFKEFNNDNGK